MTIIFPSNVNMLQYVTDKTGIFRYRWVVPKAKWLTSICHRFHDHTIALDVIKVPDFFFVQTWNTHNGEVIPTGARERTFSSYKCSSSESWVGRRETDISNCWHSSSVAEKCHRGDALWLCLKASSLPDLLLYRSLLYVSSLHFLPSGYLNHYFSNPLETCYHHLQFCICHWWV